MSYKHNRGFLVYRHFLFWASSDAIFYLHISKELIELFRIAILTFENEAHSEELWRFMCDDTLLCFSFFNWWCVKFRTNTRDDTWILLVQSKDLKKCFILRTWSQLRIIRVKNLFAFLSIYHDFVKILSRYSQHTHLFTSYLLTTNHWDEASST